MIDLTRSALRRARNVTQLGTAVVAFEVLKSGNVGVGGSSLPAIGHTGRLERSTAAVARTEACPRPQLEDLTSFITRRRESASEFGARKAAKRYASQGTKHYCSQYVVRQTGSGGVEAVPLRRDDAQQLFQHAEDLARHHLIRGPVALVTRERGMISSVHITRFRATTSLDCRCFVTSARLSVGSMNGPDRRKGEDMSEEPFYAFRESAWRRRFGATAS
jgi:hypothetical protein